MLSLGPWLLSPSVGVYGLYDTNIHSSATAPLSGPGLHFHPDLFADWDTGIYDTKLYGHIDSIVYPTLDYLNNTFDRQAGFIESYSPLRDLTFTTQGDYSHTTNAAVLTSSVPTPIISPANPAPAGAAGVIASQQTVVNPNDTYTGTATVYKEFNRAFIKLGGSILRTEYETMPSSDFDRESYNGSGGFWLTPQLYAFADGLEATTFPAVGAISSAFTARAGIGSAQIGLFKGSIFYGEQGSEVAGGGQAGGDLYGGAVTYLPTEAWDMSLSVDRIRNISNITSGAPQALGGVPLAAVGIPTNASVQVTAVAFKTDYKFSPQTSAFAVVSDTVIGYIDAPRVDSSWLASIGIDHRLSNNLSLALRYSYTRYISPEPSTSFARNLVSLGAVYKF